MNKIVIDKFELTIKETEEIVMQMISGLVFNNTVIDEQDLISYIRILNENNKNLNEIVNSIIE
jgi:hypothetical protein